MLKLIACYAKYYACEPPGAARDGFGFSRQAGALIESHDQKDSKSRAEPLRVGKDDSSLQVENLPKDPPPKEQMGLIPANADETKQLAARREKDARREAR